jgi:hypothetical protein
MKRRLNELIAVEAEFADHTGAFTHDPNHVIRPMLLPGGVNTENNVRCYLETLQRQFGADTKLRARVIYRWRSERHLKRWMERGRGSFI